MMLRRLLTGLCIVVTVALRVWAVTPPSAERAAIDSMLDVGYFIQMLATDPITIKPDPRAVDPLHTYTGCGAFTLVSSFQAQLSVVATGTNTAAGKWDATIRPSIVPRGTTQVGICVTGKGLLLGDFQAGSTVKVAQVVVSVIPR